MPRLIRRCSFCGTSAKDYASAWNLRRHLLRIHGVDLRRGVLVELTTAELDVLRRRLHIELPIRLPTTGPHGTSPFPSTPPALRRRPREDVEPSSEEERGAASSPPSRRRRPVAERVIGSPITIDADASTSDRSPVPAAAAAAAENLVDILGLLEGARLPDSSVSGDLEAPSVNMEEVNDPPPVAESVPRSEATVGSPLAEVPTAIAPEITFGDASIPAELEELFPTRAGADETFISSFSAGQPRTSGLEGLFEGSPLSWGPVVNTSTPLSANVGSPPSPEIVPSPPPPEVVPSPPPPEIVPSAFVLPASPCHSSSTWDSMILSPPSPFKDDCRPVYVDISLEDDPDAVADDPTPVLDEKDLEEGFQEIADARPSIRWLPINLGRRFMN